MSVTTARFPAIPPTSTRKPRNSASDRKKQVGNAVLQPHRHEGGNRKDNRHHFFNYRMPRDAEPTARHTIVLHKIPLTNASTRGSDVMENAMLRAFLEDPTTWARALVQNLLT